MTPPPALPPKLPAGRLDYADARSAPTSIDWNAFTAHLTGWAVFGTLLLVLVLRVFPRFEEIFTDFKLDLPAPTKAVLWLSRGGVVLVLLTAPIAIAHAFAAAALYPRSTRAGRFMYRLVLLLLIAAVVTYVVLALFLPLVVTIEGISGNGSKR